MSLIAELKRRNVFRVAIAYAVVGWLIAQVVDLAADAFGAPAWVMQMLIVLLLLGLPVALFLAWAFELTPEGMKKADEVPKDAPKDPRSGRILNVIIIATLLLIIAGLVVERFLPGDGNDVGVAPPADKSIAVLPFADFSPGGDHGWFADGLTDEILNALARTRDLRVASRTSSFAYRDTSLEIPAIAAELGVAHILEGSVRRAGDRLRVTAQLIRVADDSHLWSENFDGSSADSIAIQESIARSIATALETTMDPDELERMLDAGTNSVEAWELFIRARETGFAGDVDVAGQRQLELIERALAIDPEFGDAWAYLSGLWDSHLSDTQMLKINIDIPDAEARSRRDAAMQNAIRYARSDRTRLEIEATLAQADMRLADAYSLVDEATRRWPDDVGAWSFATALAIDTGRHHEARGFALRLGEELRRQGMEEERAVQFLHRVDAEAALPMARRIAANTRASDVALYQAHRALLWGGEVDAGREVAALFRQKNTNRANRAMVDIRQACAEGRVADADAAYQAMIDELPDGPQFINNRWLYLKTLGREAEAYALLEPLDNAQSVGALAGYLSYTHFDEQRFPYLAGLLAAQGIERPPAAEIPFACRRD